MSKPSAPTLGRATQEQTGCGCFADAAPLPMGCALCGHAPYAHGCPNLPADHDYVQPAGELMNARLEARRHGGPIRLPRFAPPADVTPNEVIPLVPAQRRPDFAAAPDIPRQTPPAVPATRHDLPPAPAADPEQPPLAAPATRPARPTLPQRIPRTFPRPGLWPAVTRPARRGDSRHPTPGSTYASTRPGAIRAAPLAPRRLSSHLIRRTRPAVASPERVHNRTMEVRFMQNASPPPTEGAIPGWRVIVSDAGRFWASRETPFSGRSERYAPPFRTVDADTFDELRAEVERQEEAARDLEAAHGRKATFEEADGQVET